MMMDTGACYIGDNVIGWGARRLDRTTRTECELGLMRISVLLSTTIAWRGCFALLIVLAFCSGFRSLLHAVSSAFSFVLLRAREGKVHEQGQSVSNAGIANAIGIASCWGTDASAARKGIRLVMPTGWDGIHAST